MTKKKKVNVGYFNKHLLLEKMKDILQYKDYCSFVRFSPEDEVFHGKILGISDLVTFEGSSVKELKKAFREAVEDYLQMRIINK